MTFEAEGTLITAGRLPALDSSAVVNREGEGWASPIDDNDTDTQGTVADDKVSSPGENSLEIAPRASTPGPSRSSSPPSSAPGGRRPLNKKARRPNDSDIELEKLEVLKEMSNTVKFGLNPEKQDKIEDESGFGRQVAVESQTSHPTSHHHAYTLPHGQPSYVQLLEDSEDN
ncbi:unnamed protein product [Leuciscus chuanchicus]